MGPPELPIVLDLIEDKKVRGEIGEGQESQVVALSGITLAGRQFRDEWIAKRDAKRLNSRIKHGSLVALGWIGGLLTAGIKALIEHVLK